MKNKLILEQKTRSFKGDTVLKYNKGLLLEIGMKNNYNTIGWCRYASRRMIFSEGEYIRNYSDDTQIIVLSKNRNKKKKITRKDAFWKGNTVH